MVVSQVVGVGIFITPATMMRTVGSLQIALAVWGLMGVLSAAGALCYAELTTRYPLAGGAYVFLREAFGARSAFVYGWMALLVMDPGITAALGIGLAQYFIAAIGGRSDLVSPIAIASILMFGALALLGINANARVMAWTAAAKLAIVTLLVGAGLVRAHTSGVDLQSGSMPSSQALAASFIAAFFAFGGWWEFGRMAEDVESPRRTMPRALVGGIAVVTAIYALASVAYTLGAPHAAPATDEAFVALVGANLFGAAGKTLLAVMVVVAVSGSLAATLLGAPRLYVAMSAFTSSSPSVSRSSRSFQRASVVCASAPDGSVSTSVVQSRNNARRDGLTRGCTSPARARLSRSRS